MVLIFFIFLGFLGCEDREFTNPYDSKFVTESPQKVSIAIINDQSVEIKWPAYQGNYEPNYVIYRSIDNELFVRCTITKQGTKEWYDNGLKVNQTYYYQISAKFDQHETPRSETQSVTTIFPGPVGVYLKPLTGVIMQITWQKHQDYGNKYQVDGYYIERKVENDEYKYLSSVPQDIFTVNDSTISPEHDYQYRVSAYNSINQSLFRESEVNCSLFHAPTNLCIYLVDDQNISLTWEDNCDFEDGYIVECGSGSGFIELARLGVDVEEYTDTEIEYGQSYTYRVKAYTNYNESEYSNQNSVIVKINPASDLFANLLDEQHVSLSWEDNCDFEEGYIVERDADAGYVELVRLDANIETYTDTEIEYRQSYTYRVKTYTNFNESEYSNETEEVEVAIPVPSGLIRTFDENYNLKLSWNDNCDFELGHKVDTSFGVKNPRHFLGLLFNLFCTVFTCCSDILVKSLPFGKY